MIIPRRGLSVYLERVMKLNKDAPCFMCAKAKPMMHKDGRVATVHMICPCSLVPTAETKCHYYEKEVTRETPSCNN